MIEITKELLVKEIEGLPQGTLVGKPGDPQHCLIAQYIRRLQGGMVSVYVSRAVDPLGRTVYFSTATHYPYGLDQLSRYLPKYTTQLGKTVAKIAWDFDSLPLGEQDGYITREDALAFLAKAE